MTDDATTTNEAFWTIQLDNVQRLVSDDPQYDGTLFAAEFNAAGMSMNADFEVFVSDIADESQVVVERLDALQDGLEMWARTLRRRQGAEAIEPTSE